MGRIAGLRGLREVLRGEVVTPEDEAYDTARWLFNGRFDALRPAAVAYPAHADDVLECVAFARRGSMPVAIRSGGHSYAGWSSGDGRLVIDVSRMAGITADGGGAVIGAGARLGEVYRTLAGEGVTIPAGTCPSVGVAGLALGGGHGVLSRAYGLTCDALTGATLVTADGRVLECDPQREPELFWGLRGAGNGNFGVVTELRFRTWPAVPVASAELLWPWSKAAAVLAAWQAWAPELPDALWSNLRLSHPSPGVASVSVAACGLSGSADLASALDRLPGGASSTGVVSRSHLDAMEMYAGDESATAPRQIYDVRTAFFDRDLDEAGIGTLLGYVERGVHSAEAVVTLVALGGAVNRVPESATAFVHRGHRFLAQYEAYWPDRASGPAADGWLREVQSMMRPHASGAMYQNAPDPAAQDWRRAYYGAAADRLAALKRLHDPGRVFDFRQAL